MSYKTTAGFLIALIALIGVFSYVTRSGAPPAAPPKPLPPPAKQRPLDTAVELACRPARGNPNAAWTVIEFGDFQSPTCGKCRPYVERLIDRSNGRAKLYFINYALPQDSFATQMALAALAACRQGKFWAMYDQLYTHQDDLNPKELDVCANAAGLHMLGFRNDMRAVDSRQMIAQQQKVGDNIGITATPTFLVYKDGAAGTKMYVGMWPTKNTGNTPGIRQLMLHCPWGTKFPKAQIPPAPPAKGLD